jgi:eukaryotic-like serine/threonine-protein kinase
MTHHAPPPVTIGRYALYAEIAAGGMASVHFARLLGHGGFSRIVAAKRVLPHMVEDGAFTAMLMDEARLAARIRHPNVVSTLDVVATEGELVVVMEYVHGESLSRLVHSANEQADPMSFRLSTSIIIDALHGLHAAHEATDELGKRLGVVHRDISPQNLLVGVDGVTRIADFGIAKAAGRSYVTQDGTIKGKLSYMAPEQILRGELTPATDVFAISIVLWELLTNRALFDGASEAEIMNQVLSLDIPTASSISPGVSPELDRVLALGLSRDPAQRFRSAREMALELEAISPSVRASDIGAWVERTASETLRARSRLISQIELSSSEEELAFAATKSVAPSARSVTPPPNTSAHVSWAGAAPKRTSSWIPLIVVAGLAVGGVSARLLIPRTPTTVSASTSGASLPLSLPRSPPAEPLPSSALPSTAPSAPPSVVKPAAKSVRPSPPKAPEADCRTPYVVDSAGRRIFKLECM